MDQPLLEVRHLRKSFPGLRALDDVALTVHRQQIVAIVGENGSGKSTLAKILAGVYTADDGAEILIDGAMRGEAGDRLHFIHQDLALIPTLSTVENLDLVGRLGGAGWRPFRRREERAHTRELIQRFGADFDVDRPVSELSPAERAVVAITRALDGWDRLDNVLVLDEPTEALHGEEVHKLFRAVREVAHRGAGIVFISHRLDEVVDLADRVVVLRDGRVVGQLRRGHYEKGRLTELIVGRELLEAEATRRAVATDQIVMVADGVAGPGVMDFSMKLHRGEVVGVAGVIGSGRDQVCRTLYGAGPRAAGTVSVQGSLLQPAQPRDAMRAGVAFVPAERSSGGAVMDFSARENLTLPDLPVRPRWRLDRGRERSLTEEWMRKVDLRPPRPNQALRLFSGGNQQKIVLAKWLRTNPEVLLLDEPTQGVDVGAKATIYELINQATERGAGVLLASADTRELSTLCDRVLVMRNGLVALELRQGDISEGRLVRESMADDDENAGPPTTTKIRYTNV